MTNPQIDRLLALSERAFSEAPAGAWDAIDRWENDTFDANEELSDTMHEWLPGLLAKIAELEGERDEARGAAEATKLCFDVNYKALIEANARADALLAERDAASARVGEMREAFYNLIADADRFDEDVDGDEVNGRTVITVNYHLTVGNSQLEELCDALGVPKARYDETLQDRILRAIDEPSTGDAK